MPAVDSANVEAQVFAKLNAWGFTPGHNIGVAYSGGGDSTALLALMLKWSDSGHVYAFIVDHALRSGSGKEAKLAEKRALAMGAQTKILTCQWPEGVPTTGIQEKARNARYQLLGDACRGDVCREQGIENLFLGHNQDDQAETVLMRKGAGSGWRGLAGMAGRSIAPLWPALHGVTIVRPMLDIGREQLRGYNRKFGLGWIDDPSNENRSFARIRVREYLANHKIEKQNLLLTARAASEILALEKAQIADFIKNTTVQHAWGGMTLLPAFSSGKCGQCAEALKYILPAISGQAFAPSKDKRMHLARRLRAQNFNGATLGGVRLVPDKNGILCVRDLGILLGRAQVSAIRPMHLQLGKEIIWDGRFLVSTAQANIDVDVLGNWIEKLDKAQKQALSNIPEQARGGLPVLTQNGQVVFMPLVDSQASHKDFSIRTLTDERLSAILEQ